MVTKSRNSKRVTRKDSDSRSGPRAKRTPSKLPQSDPQRKPFTPENLDKTIIAIPLLNILNDEERRRSKNPRLPRELHPVIIDLNLEFPGGREIARTWVIEETKKIVKNARRSAAQGINLAKSEYSEQYLFARLDGEAIRELVRRDTEKKPEFNKGKTGLVFGPNAIYHIWPDFKIKPFINRSISTIKADAAHVSFSAFGESIVWAVMDSGIEGDHPHFKLHKNLELRAPLKHEDFTVIDAEGEPLVDVFGHGTHVAGIIAGEMSEQKNNGDLQPEIFAYSRQRDETGEIAFRRQTLDSISGMAPKCKLVSLKVLDDDGAGETSSLIAAIARIQRINGHGRRLLIHGVNLSLGYQFEPEWFACGQSPLCVEVDRLVRSGVVVVVAAGNSGYGHVKTEFYGNQPAGLDMTIDDPGNAELAITVGATHRDSPHVYGVSYFSSKGPTGDGRAKPDLLAPGEKILSCAAGDAREVIKKEIKKQLKKQKGKAPQQIQCDYLEESGTSMATPHVSGVVAAFLSVRREFIGQPERVKEIFLSTATDLNRERYFQGHGLVDLMRAIQSV